MGPEAGLQPSHKSNQVRVVIYNVQVRYLPSPRLTIVITHVIFPVGAMWHSY